MAYLNGCRGAETLRKTAPSYSGLVRCPLTAVTRVRIPLGSHDTRKPPDFRGFSAYPATSGNDDHLGRLAQENTGGVGEAATRMTDVLLDGLFLKR